MVVVDMMHAKSGLRCGMRFERSPLEQWFTEHPGPYRFNLGSTAVGALSRDDLARLLPEGFDLLGDWAYGEPAGDRRLRERLADDYGCTASQVLLTHGAVEANFLALACLLRAGDEVIGQSPIYPQLPCVVEGFGSRFLPWLLPGDDAPLDWSALDVLWGPKTRLVVLNFPHSPSGRHLTIEDRAALNRRLDAWPDTLVLLDEVYQGVGLGAPAEPTHQRHPRWLVSNSVSKSWGLPGARVGWLIAPEAVINDALVWREHLSLSLASNAVALVNSLWPQRQSLLALNQALLERNQAIVDACVWPASVNRPRLSGSTGTFLLGCERGLDDRQFARALYQRSRTFVVPASTVGYPGYLRIGFGHRDVEQLRGGLNELAAALNALT
jgi:aspartate/methionine/tyrosine aminotransferase